jgi:hypothetical protein
VLCSANLTRFACLLLSDLLQTSACTYEYTYCMPHSNQRFFFVARVARVKTPQWS